MLDQIEQIFKEIEILPINNLAELEVFRIKYLSKKGIISQLFEDFKTVPNEIKKNFGQQLNNLKIAGQAKYDACLSEFSKINVIQTKKDLSAPSDNVQIGSRHPISLIKNEICQIFGRIGFNISEGPEIEDDWHVFSALNFPSEHPARDMQDTFFIEKNPDILLRTHTSSVQIRVMERQKPPIRIVMPGRVFRNEAISYRSHCIFHQIEGLYIDKNVSFADLKQTLIYYGKEMFGSGVKIRLRPSYFPFTEPSAEMDISCSLCKGKGCNVCKHSGWLEVAGSGMVDPSVLENCHIDSSNYSGFAFGMGVERTAMLKYDIKDLRIYFENDIRFLKQFSAAL